MIIITACFCHLYKTVDPVPVPFVAFTFYSYKGHFISKRRSTTGPMNEKYLTIKWLIYTEIIRQPNLSTPIITLYESLYVKHFRGSDVDEIELLMEDTETLVLRTVITAYGVAIQTRHQEG